MFRPSVLPYVTAVIVALISVLPSCRKLVAELTKLVTQVINSATKLCEASTALVVQLTHFARELRRLAHETKPPRRPMRQRTKKLPQSMRTDTLTESRQLQVQKSGDGTRPMGR